MQFRTIPIAYVTGKPAVGAEVEVFDANTETLQEVYDESGTALVQPLVANEFGEVSFAAPNGIYDLNVGVKGASRKIENLQFSDWDSGEIFDDVATLQTDVTGLKADTKGYATRAAFVSAVTAGYAPDDGTVITADGLSYVRETGATEFGDLPGWTRFGMWLLEWDASGGTFPSGSTAGDRYFVAVAGTVDGDAYAVGDSIVARSDNASTTDKTAWNRYLAKKTPAQVRDELGIYNGARHIKDFCPANGVDDDGPGLQLALNSGVPIIGDSVVLNIQTQAVVAITSFGASLKGVAGGAKGITPLDGFRVESPLNNALRVECSAFQIENVTFEHKGTVRDANAQALVIDHESTGTNTDDIDSLIKFCTFKDYGAAVRQNGRGIVFDDNTVSNCAEGVIISFPTTGTEGDPIQSDGDLGFRKNSFSRNTGHNIGTLVRQTGTFEMQGADILGNRLDLGDTIFTGAIRDSAISDNICRFSEGREGMVYITGAGSFCTITGNVGMGGDLTGAMAGTHMIEFDTGADVFGAVVANNFGRNWAWALIASGTGTVLNSCIIQGNSGEFLGRDGIILNGNTFGTTIIGNNLRDYGRDNTARGGLRLTGSHERLIVTANQFAPLLSTARNVFMVSTPTLTKCLLKDNQGHYTSEFITGAFTNTGSTVTPNII